MNKQKQQNALENTYDSFFLRMMLFLILLVQPIYASQVVLVTGASRGIGLATAELMVQEGYTVYAGARATSPVAALSAIQAKYPEDFCSVELDVTDPSTIDKAFETLIGKEGRIDILVNNAGIGVLGTVENITIEQAQQIFDVNFFGVMRVVQPALPHMRAQKSGKIIQIGSRSGWLSVILSSWAQSPLEIAHIVKEAAEADQPLFRYQTTDEIKAQAALRFVAPTGVSSVTEWQRLLFGTD